MHKEIPLLQLTYTHIFMQYMQIKSSQIIQTQTKQININHQHAAARVYCMCDLGMGDES